MRLTPEQLEEIREWATEYSRWIEQQECAPAKEADWIVDLLAHIDALEEQRRRITAFCDKRKCVLSDAHHETVTNLRHECRRYKAENARLREILEQEVVRLASCGAAALGYADNVKPGDYGHSAALDDVLTLRADNARLQAELDYCKWYYSDEQVANRQRITSTAPEERK